MADKRVYFFPYHPGDSTEKPEGELVEAKNAAQARDILIAHLYAEPRVATTAELIRLTKAGVEVVRAGE